MDEGKVDEDNGNEVEASKLSLYSASSASEMSHHLRWGGGSNHLLVDGEEHIEVSTQDDIVLATSAANPAAEAFNVTTFMLFWPTSSASCDES